MTAAGLFHDLELPCGCKIGNRIVDGQKAFVIEPCSLRCPQYLAAVGEARKAGMSPEFRQGHLRPGRGIR